MSEILTSIILNFSGTSDFKCKYELDAKLNNDKGTFGIDEPAHFIVQHSDNVRIREIKATNGSIFYLREVTRTKKDYCLFTELPVPTESLPSLSFLLTETYKVTWLGNIGGRVLIDKIGLTASISTGEVPCECLITYPSKFKLYKLVPGEIVFPTDETTYTIKIVIYLEEI